MHYFISNNNKGRVHQNLYFITSREGVVELGCDHIADIVKMRNFKKIFLSNPCHKADKLDYNEEII